MGSSSTDESDAPPPYEIHSESDVLQTTTRVSDTGAINISLSSHHPTCLSSLFTSALDQRPAQAPADRAISSSVPALNIVVQVVGSRGDVQPFIALARELHRFGHRVRIASHAVFADFVRESGVEFYAIGGDPTELMAYMVKNPGIIPSLDSMKGGDIGRKRAMIGEMLHGCYEACFRPDEVSGQAFVADAIIANPPSFAHAHCAQALGIPVHIVFTMPWSATRQFAHPLANLSPGNVEPGVANYLSYGVVELMTWQGLGDVINKWRRIELGLPDIPSSMGPGLATYLRLPHTYCWSPALVAKPEDWGEEIDVCGFFMRDEPAYEPPEDLREFLDKGTPPVYVGFGSIVLDDPRRFVDIVLHTASTCGFRVTISRGWSKLGEGLPNDENVFFLGDCPHEWLFKRVTAVVHHGGAGTTACGLFNACPTLIIPFFGDQPFWGSLIASAGAGPSPIPQRELDVQTFEKAIKICLAPATKEAAHRISVKMRQENGIARAVESFHRQLPLGQMTCQVFPDHAARWMYKRNRWTMRLSDRAVAALLDAKEIDQKHVYPLRVREYDTDVQRWDPVTGGASAMLGTLTDFTSAVGGIFIDPFAEYRRVQRTGTNKGAKTAAAASLGTNAGAAAGAIVKGTLVDVPLALTEGLRNLPRLYGGEVDPINPITDWKSGGIAAGKTLGTGFYKGITGFVTQPVKGAREEGTLGFMKGVGKGSVELFTRPGVAMFGLAAYPAQGIYKSIQKRKFNAKADSIMSSKMAMLAEASRAYASEEPTMSGDVGRKFRITLGR